MSSSDEFGQPGFAARPRGHLSCRASCPRVATIVPKAIKAELPAIQRTQV